MRNLLIVDTSYLAHRVLGQLNMNENVNNLESEFEKTRFVNELRNSLVNLYKTFNNSKHRLVDQIILCCDNMSWRKDVKPFKPYWLTDETVPLKYKEQRVEKKQESTINYENFYPLVDAFLDSVKDIVTVLKIKGLEGDDNMLLMSTVIKNTQNTKGIIFCTDGDIEQVVNDSVLIMKNSRSKVAPNGEFVMNLNTYTKLFESSPIEQMLGNNIETSYYNDLFKIYIGDIEGTTIIKRTLHSGIEIASPFKILLLKSVCGDKKDNLFSVISWLSSTGTRRYGVTEKHITKALDSLGLSLIERDCEKVINDPELLKSLLREVSKVTKQENIDLDYVYNHTLHNLRLNGLYSKNIPSELIDEFKIWIKENKESVFEKSINQDEMESLFVQQNYMPKENKGINVMEQSLKDLI